MFLRMLLLRGLCLAALAASAASLADQSFGDGAFCGFESGCDAVTHSQYGTFLGLPLSAFGILGFSLILGSTLIGGEFAAMRLTRSLALAAAAAGLILITVQAVVLKQFCELCLIADLCAVAIAVVSLWPMPRERPSSAARGITAVLAVLAVLAPLAFAYSDVKPDPPDWVKARWVPDRVTIVEVTDFECEHCRRADEYVREAVKTRTDVVLVRIPIEMPKHAHSRAAAIAYLGAKAQNRGTEMAEGLFAATALTAPDCRSLAAKLGLDMTQYDRVVADPATEAEVLRLTEAAKVVGPGVPLIWIQSHLSYGSPTLQNFDEPLRTARPHRVR